MTARGTGSFITRGGWVVAAALGLFYVGFVMHFAVDIPQGDEWGSVLPLVHSALHHELSVGQLWTQYFNESHLLIPNAIFVAVGLWGHFDTRTLIGLSALLQCASFLVLLGLFRVYLGRVVTAVPVLLLGLTWLGLSGIDNALWGFQIQIYLTEFFLLLSLLCLHFSFTGPRRLPLLAGALFFGLASSCSTIQGLLVWPIGLLVILWVAPKSPRRLALWCGTAVVMAGLYLIGYNSAEARAGCIAATTQACSVTYGVHHLGPALDYFLALLGNIVPATDKVLTTEGNVHVFGHQLLGAVFLLAAIGVFVQSYHQRRSRSAMWVPPSLIIFALLWDVVIALGRVGEGPASAVSSHLSTPQTFLLSGILMSGVLTLRQLRDHDQPAGTWRIIAAWSALAGLGILMAVVVVTSTIVGNANAVNSRRTNEFAARVVVNLDVLPSSVRPCYLDASIDGSLVPESQVLKVLGPALDVLRADHLTVFGSLSEYQYYRKLGPPLFSFCPRG